MSGETHNVITGVSIVDSLTKKELSDYEISDVKFSVLTDERINSYINTKEYYDKAGSYAIQGIGAIFVEKIIGCYFNVVGLPLNKLDKTFFKSEQFGKKKKIQWAVVIATHISEKEKIDKICREKITEFSFAISSGKPKDLLKSLKKDISDIKKEKKDIIKDLQVYLKNQLDELLAIREEIYFTRVRREASKNFAQTQSSY